MKLYLAIIMALFLIHCNTSDRQTKFQEGEFSILADTSSSGYIHGPAVFYNKTNRVVKRIHYKNGVKDGPAVNYYDNGMVMDSVLYVNGKEVNFRYHFDSTGKLTSKESYFFGKRLGSEEYYDRNGIIRYYYFTDFERRDIVFAKYDYQGKLYENDLFRLQFIAKPSGYDTQMVNVFAYLPKLPACDVKYHICVAKSKNEMRKLFEVKNELFIDTLLPKLDSDWTYYISCDIQQQSGNFKRVYIEEYTKK